MGVIDWLQHKWSLLSEDDQVKYPPAVVYQQPASSYRPDRTRYRMGNERTIVTAIYTRIAIDCAAVMIQHVRVDENGRFAEVMNSGLQNCLSLEANLDQTGRAFIQDVVMSLCDEGCVAVVPTDTDIDPDTGSFQIETLRVAKILQWYPGHVQVRIYNEKTGNKQDVIISKRACAIIENPLYAVMNEPSSTLRRLISKLSMLDAVDAQNSSGKLNMIIQLPYIIKTPQRKAQAEQRRKDIEMQLMSSKYGIAYTDGTERITQINQPLENKLFEQVEYLTTMLYNQLGMTKEVLEGTADEQTMLNYHNRTIEPILSAITDEFKRKFLSKTARTQGQSIMVFRDAFKLTPVSQLADIADKMTRNEILSPNEVRATIGYKPNPDPESDQLRNRNIQKPDEEKGSEEQTDPAQEKINQLLAQEQKEPGSEEAEELQNGSPT